MINMLVAVDICTEEYAPVWNIVGLVVNIIKIGIPIVLILFGMIDLGKAVIAGKEDEQKKATKLLGKKFLYAVGVFASVWIVTFVLDLASETIGKNNDSYNYDEASWKKCWNLISNGETSAESACYLCTSGEKYRWGDYSSDNNCRVASGITTKSNCKEEQKNCYSFEIGEETIYLWQSDSIAKKKGYDIVSDVTNEGACLSKNK